MSSGCGCKEVYRFPHITYPYSALFCSSIPTFCSFFECFSLLYIIESVDSISRLSEILHRRNTLQILEYLAF